MSLSPGTTLGPYSITAELGHGGMGVVYTAQDPRLKRQVAIKLLPPDLTSDETAKQRFQQEAQAASALDHPNICTIFEINETDDGQLYLVMAHYEGETLKDRIERGAVALDVAVDIATQVGRGLVEAHAAGIVHRDIKPANLLVTKSGTVKILDFGLAKLVGAEGLTQTGTAVGTVAYMSPEQARGEPVDHRTDIWSLGVVLYEMVSGQPPFRGENLLTLSKAILEGTPAALTDASSTVQRAVLRALSKTRQDRHQAVGALLDELDRAIRSGGQAAGQIAVAETAVTLKTSPARSASPETVTCRACDRPNRENARFCEQCGAPLVRLCSSCGTRLSDEVRFCGECGAPIESSTEADETLQVGVAACQGILLLGWRIGMSAADSSDLFEEGCRLASQNGDLLALAALNGSYACVRGLVDGLSDEYVRYAREATRLAEQTENQGLQIAQRAFFGFACVFAANFAEGIDSCAESGVRFPEDPALGIEFTGYSPYLGILTSHAWMLVRSGRYAEGATVWERGDTLARQHGDLEVLTWLQLPGVERDVVFGDAASARARARSALESSEECATPQARMVAHVVLGIAHRLSGEWNEAVATLEEALLAATTGANRMFEGLVRAELAIAVLGQGDVDRAEREAQTSVDVAHESHSRCDEVRGSLALAQTQLIRANDPALLRVEAALGRAQELIHETGVRAQQPELHECRGRLAQLRGDLVAAELEIGLARSMYEEMGATEQVARLAAESSS